VEIRARKRHATGAHYGLKRAEGYPDPARREAAPETASARILGGFLGRTEAAEMQKSGLETPFRAVQGV